jgi:hypothetical protein
MATSEYIDSVVALADKTLDAYQPGSLLHRALQPLDDDDRLEDGTLFATIEGDSKDLRSVTAVLGAVQLAFDAAMVVVSYAATKMHGTPISSGIWLAIRPGPWRSKSSPAAPSGPVSRRCSPPKEAGQILSRPRPLPR